MSSSPLLPTTLRSPICSVLGHVDHGKSSILDKIRGTAIIAKEAGGITQSIGASMIPLSTIMKICGDLLAMLKMDLTIPGLLFIDTPGHAAFTTLRKRGGSLADIAIVVVDLNEGFKPQTIEAIDILKEYKTPFVIAANKIDLVPGWQNKHKNILQSIQLQQADAGAKVDERLYTAVGQLYDKNGMKSERFDRVDDFTKQVAIVPCSAKTGEGLPELIMVLTGLAQRFLEQHLTLSAAGQAKATILEVKEEKGMGKTIDAILYDGTLRVNDTIIIGSLGDPIVTKVRGLFEPTPLSEMRDAKTKFKPIKSAIAACGVKISAPDTDTILSGMPIRSCVKGTKEELEETKRNIQQDVENVLIETDSEGIVIKADNIGSLEAMIKLLQDKGFTIRRAGLGDISKKDLADAESNWDQDPLQCVILGFNVHAAEDLCGQHPKVKIILSDVIYRLLDELEQWKKEHSQKVEELQLSAVVRPCKIQIMKGYVFRQNNPAVVGCEIMSGTARTGMAMMDANGKEITTIKGMQVDKENVSEAARGKQLAISLDRVSVGRQINEGDVLYSAVPEEDFRKMKGLKKYLKPDEVEAIKEIALIRRKDSPVWGI
ncbi:translation initiation factor IF-2 [Candidatus Woesearchaeota archaeon]|nr:translation initiation factor IF-2 [Candidatus Woesearchaeota archaeon]